MRSRTPSLLRAVEHPVVRVAFAALLQAAAEHLARAGAGAPSCAHACEKAT